MAYKISKSEEEWQKQLTPAQYAVCRQKATERPFTGEYNDCKEEGVYTCVCCGADLFSSSTKYNSGSGWPSFWEPINDASVATETDYSHGMERVEALCNTCGAHLGHIFPDGPQPTGQRYCMNSLSLKLEKKGE